MKPVAVSCFRWNLAFRPQSQVCRQLWRKQNILLCLGHRCRFGMWLHPLNIADISFPISFKEAILGAAQVHRQPWNLDFIGFFPLLVPVMARLMPDLNAARMFTKLANQEGYERRDLGSGICDERKLPSYRHPPKWRRLIAGAKGATVYRRLLTLAGWPELNEANKSIRSYGRASFIGGLRQSD
jgi:hypothetical protein